MNEADGLAEALAGVLDMLISNVPPVLQVDILKSLEHANNLAAVLITAALDDLEPQDG